MLAIASKYWKACFMNPEDLERWTLDRLWEAIKTNKSITVREIERRLGKRRGWLTRRLRGEQAGMRLSALFAVLQVLEVQPADFFSELPGGAGLRPAKVRPGRPRRHHLNEKARAKIEGEGE